MRKSVDARIIKCFIGSVDFEVLVDSGATVNTVTPEVWLEIRKNCRTVIHELELQPKESLKAFASNNDLKVICSFSCFIGIRKSKQAPKLAKFFVVSGSKVSLLSYQTAIELNLIRIGIQAMDESQVFNVNKEETKLAKFPKIPIEGVKFRVNKQIVPKQIIRYNIPKAFEQSVNERLNKMEIKGIIERADKDDHQVTSVSPLVLVPKGKNDFRIVVDYREVNKAIIREPYPLPSLERVWTEIPTEGQELRFTKLDLKDAFFHIELHEDVRHFTTFMTANGLMRFKRLPFGLSVAPELFQKIMEKVFLNCKGVIVYLDDILVFGAGENELEQRVAKVMDVVSKNNLTLNMEKSEFNKKSIDFLGLTLDGTGILPMQAKLSAIKSFKRPKDISELRSFLGMITFISPFIKNFSEKTKELRDLLPVKKFNWNENHQKAFEKLKTVVNEYLIKRGYFNSKDDVILYTDASPWGLGAILVQTNKNSGSNRIIACTSKSLTKTEARYPQLHREALAIVWAMEKFSYYLLGRRFTLKSDSKALMFMIKNKDHKDVGKRIMTRAEGWFLRLEYFDFDFVHIPGKDNIADAPSRLGNTEAKIDYGVDKEPHELFNVTAESSLISKQVLALSNKIVRDSMKNDQETKLVVEWLHQNGEWPEQIAKYKPFKDDLYIQNDVLMKQEKLVLPAALRNQALKVAHVAHPGMSTMKHLLRQGVWWPGIDREVEDYVKKCPECQLVTKSSKPLPIVLTKLPRNVWDYVSMDFSTASDKEKWKALVLTDHYSRFLIAIPMTKTDTEAVKHALTKVFQTYYVPKILKADNGPPFNSQELDHWLEKRWGIKLDHSTALNPTENGLVERNMQGINKISAIARLTKQSWKEALEDYVSAYNTWPHHVTKIPPAELMFGRSVRTILPNIKTDEVQELDEELRDRDQQAKFKRNTREDLKRRAQENDLQIGDTVLVAQQKRDKADTPYKNTLHKITQIEGAGRTTCQDTSSGKTITRNVKHLKKYYKPHEENKLVQEIAQETQEKKPADKLITQLGNSQADPTIPQLNTRRKYQKRQFLQRHSFVTRGSIRKDNQLEEKDDNSAKQASSPTRDVSSPKIMKLN